MPPTIALVDDDRNILESVRMALEAEGFLVVTYSDGATALSELLVKPVDLAVIDIKMPGMDGIEVLQRLRKTVETPVIFLTSKNDEIDQLLGLKMGADDYIPKPFSQRILIERIRAVLRRADAREPGDLITNDGGGMIVRNGLVLDPARHLCEWNKQAIQLTVTEFLILQALATRPGIVKSRDQLMDAAYGEQIYVDDRTIDSHIKRLRKKIRSVDGDFTGIETLYGLGYRFNAG